eukprot:jgi/Undpi1/13958/HiC_scaffold_9.g03609.m1
MADVVGAMASIASVLLNISPIKDVRDIHRTRCVTERSILPYCMMMVDGANWVLFAILIEDTFPIGMTNAFGFLAGSAYSSVYLYTCWNDKREHVRREAWCIFLSALFVIMLMTAASIVVAVVWSRKTATDHIGYVVDVFNVALYSSPLALAWKVLRTRSTSGMYLPLSITITAAAILWATYGFMTLDWFVAAPQSVGFLAGVAQLSLFLRVLVVLIGDETIGIINVFGFLAGLVYSIVYLTAACRDAARENVHRVASRLFLGTLVVIALTSLVGVVLAGRGSRKSAVDHIVYVAYLFDVMLYASPLVLFLKVLRSGKTSGMYLPLSLAITGTAVLKAAYAYQISFWLFGVPQFIGVFLGLVQLLLFLRFGVADNNEPYETIPLIADASMWWAS